MMSLYQKAVNLSNYIRDLMYMHRYYLDMYSHIQVVYTANRRITPVTALKTVRSFKFESNMPEDVIFSSIQYKESYDILMTLTSSYTHIKNNTQVKRPKYFFVQHPVLSLNDYESTLPGDTRHLFSTLRDAIKNNTVSESEFQMLMIHKDFQIAGYYLTILLNDDLNNIQYADKEVALCLGSTDILRFVPARKAFIDLLDERAPNDWRETISNNYGHTIK